MKRRVTIFLAGVCALQFASLTAFADVTTVQGFLRVEYARPQGISGEQELVQLALPTLLSSERLQKQAAAEVSGIPVEQLEKHPDAIWPAISERRGRVNPTPVVGGLVYPVHTHSTDDRVPAAKFVEIFSRLLQEELERFDKEDRRGLEQQVHVAQLAVLEAGDEHKSLSALQAELAQRAGAGLSHEHLQAQLQKLVTDRQQVAVDRHGLEARLGALAEQIAELAQQVEATAADDAVIVELAKVVNAREAEFARVRALVKTGAITPAQANQAEGELAQARADVERYRREIVREAGGDRLRDVHSLLMQTVVDLAEAEARLDYLDGEVIPEARSALAATREVEEISSKMEVARLRLVEATARRDDVMWQLRSRLKPKVTFLPL